MKKHRKPYKVEKSIKSINSTADKRLFLFLINMLEAWTTAKQASV
jgi:hypothetical protein